MKIFILIMLTSLCGCVHFMPTAVSNAALGPKEHLVAMVSAQSEAVYIFGLGPLGDDSMQAAIENVKKKANGDTLINTFVDRKMFCFPLCAFSLYTSVTTSIYGTLIKYEDDPKGRSPDISVKSTDSERQILKQ